MLWLTTVNSAVAQRRPLQLQKDDCKDVGVTVSNRDGISKADLRDGQCDRIRSALARPGRPAPDPAGTMRGGFAASGPATPRATIVPSRIALSRIVL